MGDGNAENGEKKTAEMEEERYWTSGRISTAFVVSVGKFVQLLCCLGLAPFYPEEVDITRTFSLSELLISP